MRPLVCAHLNCANALRIRSHMSIVQAYDLSWCCLALVSFVWEELDTHFGGPSKASAPNQTARARARHASYLQTSGRTRSIPYSPDKTVTEVDLKHLRNRLIHRRYIETSSTAQRNGLIHRLNSRSPTVRVSVKGTHASGTHSPTTLARTHPNARRQIAPYADLIDAQDGKRP